MPASVPAILLNPKAAAIIAKMKKTSVQFNIDKSFCDCKVLYYSILIGLYLI